MCDTFGKVIKKGHFAIFGKNSDRENDEAQIVQYIPSKNNSEKYLKTTYIKIKQVEKTASIFISKPTWMWGAEMGVNEFGVCIGNEALYANKYDNPEKGLIGMDLVRLGLERGKTAKESLDIIIDLLKKYGQGGCCSLKNKDLYDNSFLIMDLNDCYILETKNKHWLYKKVNWGAISNTFSITKPDKFSDISNFKNTFSLNRKTSGGYRVNLMKKPVKKLKNVSQAINILKLHNKKDKNLSEKKKSICMHGEYSTAGSMVVELKKDHSPKIYFTATSFPCKSIYLPYNFGDSIVKPINKAEENNDSFWQSHKSFVENTKDFDENKLNKIQNEILLKNLSLKESLKLRKQIFK